MAALEVLTVDPAAAEAARLTVPQTGDHYDLPRRAEMAFETLTGSAADAALDISGTWNTTGTPTALKLNVTDTASNASSLLMDLQVGGSSKFAISKGGMITLSGTERVGFGVSGSSDAINLRSSGSLRWSSNTQPTGSSDTILERDAANTLALRNSTNAQAFNVYNTYTDASNYERGFARWNSNVFEIGTAAAGTGSNRSMKIYQGGTARIALGDFTSSTVEFWPGGVVRAMFTSSGNLISRSVIGLSNDYFGLSSSSTTSSSNSADTKLERAAAGVFKINGASAGGGLATPDAGELTIATGAVTATGSFHTIDTESDAASDDLDTINGGTDGMFLTIMAEDGARTVVAKDGTGNLQLSGDCTLDNAQDTLTLLYVAALSAWVEISRSDNGA